MTASSKAPHQRCSPIRAITTAEARSGGQSRGVAGTSRKPPFCAARQLVDKTRRGESLHRVLADGRSKGAGCLIPSRERRAGIPGGES
jgi:hypothetical protein